jgi:hypothetical protein
MVTLLGWMVPASCFATVVGTSTLEQPVNLGAKSDPARIPLGRVGVISNHGYGVQLMIGEARSCPDGAMRWEGGSELDQNLASVFGISVETEDSTQISSFPVTLRVKPWKPPGYCPYTKDQVLAATLWCLLRSIGGTPENPLDVRVVAEGPDDKPLETKYSGKYVTSPGKDKNEMPPVKVAGTALEEDARGITWVTFPDVTRKATSIPPSPGMIILEAGGDGDGGWHVLPVWGNGRDENEFLRLNSWSAAMCYSSWHSRGVTEANSFLAEGGVSEFRTDRGEKSDSVIFNFPRVKEATLAADILALVISVQPTEARPLTVSVVVDEPGRYPAFRSAAGWKETHHDGAIECEFVWDAAARKLTKGSVPLVQMEELGWISLKPVDTPTVDVQSEIAEAASQLADAVGSRIKSGIQDGTLLAEKIMADRLSDAGLHREIEKAGFYDGLAIFCNRTAIPEKPLNDPVWFNKPELDQSHEAGWTIGLNQGEAIANEVRKAIEEAKLKKGE